MFSLDAGLLFWDGRWLGCLLNTSAALTSLKKKKTQIKGIACSRYVCCPRSDLEKLPFKKHFIWIWGQSKDSSVIIFSWANICKIYECLWLYTAGNHILPHQCCHVFWMEGREMHCNHSTLSLSLHSFLCPLPPSFLTYLFLTQELACEREEVNV